MMKQLAKIYLKKKPYWIVILFLLITIGCATSNFNEIDQMEKKEERLYYITNDTKRRLIKRYIFYLFYSQFYSYLYQIFIYYTHILVSCL
jgi:hypothetical protein